MRRIRLAVALALSLLAPFAGEEQPTAKAPRIGILRPGSPPDPPVEAFRQGLHELGYAEGRNISIEYRWAEGRDERLPSLAADLVRLQIDVIVAGAAAVAAKQVTNVIPIVMPTGDPVKLGLVASLARPGGNVTGLTSLSEELPGKWMEFVKETLPRVSRVAVLWDPAGDLSQVRTAEVAAGSMGMRVQVLKVGRPDGFESAFTEANKNYAGALIVLGSPFFYAQRTRLVELAAKHRLPAIYAQREFVASSGGLMSYGTDFHSLFRRAATYV